MSSAAQYRRQIVFLFAAAMLGFLSAPSSFAHEQKVALTDIFFNPRTGNLEIAHRFRLHDAEHALKKATESKADLASSEDAQAAFGKYVAKRFELSLKDKTKLKLTLLGQEIEDGYLWVYQETKIPDPIGTPFFIENKILQDVVNEQVNTVNVRHGKRVATFEFSADSGKQRYSGAGDAEVIEANATER